MSYSLVTVPTLVIDKENNQLLVYTKKGKIGVIKYNPIKKENCK